MAVLAAVGWAIHVRAIGVVFPYNAMVPHNADRLRVFAAYACWDSRFASLYARCRQAYQTLLTDALRGAVSAS